MHEPILINEPEYLKERKRINQPKVIPALGSSADRRRRRELIVQTVRAWYNISPKYAKWIANYLEQITKVEHKNGEWKSGKGYCSLRLPRELFISLRTVFKTHAPDLEVFGTNDDDIRILYEEFPKLVPTGIRTKARKN